MATGSPCTTDGPLGVHALRDAALRHCSLNTWASTVLYGWSCSEATKAGRATCHGEILQEMGQGLSGPTYHKP